MKERNFFMKQHYEMMYIIPMKYAVEDLESIFKKVRETLQKFGGEITSEKNLGNQKLAYPIKQVLQAYYIILEFDCEKENIKPFERSLRLIDEVLRHMIVTKKIKTAEEKEKEGKLLEKISREQEERAKQELEKDQEKLKESEHKSPVQAPAVKKEVKVSLEDLDKKLDEILDEKVL